MKIEVQDTRRLIARLAVAVMAADGRITPSEMEVFNKLDELGLGNLTAFGTEEIQRAVEQPVDIRKTCEQLSSLGPEANAVILTALTAIASSDRELTQRELEMLETIAGLFRLSDDVAGHILSSAVEFCAAGRTTGEKARTRPSNPRQAEGAQTNDPEVERAFELLGLGPDATRADVDEAYCRLLERYDPVKVIGLGPEFASLAVRKLAHITRAFEIAAASLESR